MVPVVSLMTRRKVEHLEVDPFTETPYPEKVRIRLSWDSYRWWGGAMNTAIPKLSFRIAVSCSYLFRLSTGSVPHNLQQELCAWCIETPHERKNSGRWSRRLCHWYKMIRSGKLAGTYNSFCRPQAKSGSSYCTDFDRAWQHHASCPFLLR
jgi:hypothetical protein